jgi:hypothetical protein
MNRRRKGRRNDELNKKKGRNNEITAINKYRVNDLVSSAQP